MEPISLGVSIVMSIGSLFGAGPGPVTCEYSPSSEVVSVRTLLDVSDSTREYTLYELDDGYAIYEGTWDDPSKFFEGSLASVSPYSGVIGDDLYYGGPGEYYVYHHGEIKDVDDCRLPTAEPANISEDEAESVMAFVNQFDIIPNARYFALLDSFPYNADGTCGLVALAIYIGYLAIFHSARFLPYGTGFSNGSEVVSTPNSSTSCWESLSLGGSLSYGQFPFALWDRLMPGTTENMQDMLMSKIHTYLNLNPSVLGITGYPMEHTAIQATMADYMNSYMGGFPSGTSQACNFASEATIKSILDQGRPLILTYFPNTGDIWENIATMHDVIVYGYRETSTGTRYLVHMGWYPDTLNGTHTELSGITPYGYYAIQFTGTHEHLHIKSIQPGPYRYNCCACGHVSRS